jgi:hypothetical protein
MSVSFREAQGLRALPMFGCETTADYGMGLVPIFYFCLLKSAAMDGRFLIFAIKDDCKGNSHA